MQPLLRLSTYLCQSLLGPWGPVLKSPLQVSMDEDFAPVDEKFVVDRAHEVKYTDLLLENRYIFLITKVF